MILEKQSRHRRVITVYQEAKDKLHDVEAIGKLKKHVQVQLMSFYYINVETI